MAIRGAGSKRTARDFVLTRDGFDTLARSLRTRASRGQAAPVRLRGPVFDGSVTDFVRTAVPLPLAAERLPGILADATAGGVPVVVAADSDLPPCCLGPELRRHEALQAGPGAAPSHADRYFGAACRGCALSDRCPGLSCAYAVLVGDDGLRRLRPNDLPTGLRPRARRPARRVGPADWRKQARETLTGRPGRALRVGDLLPLDRLPALACILPWTRLDLFPGGKPPARHTYGPCCSVFPKEMRSAPPGASPAELFDSDWMQDFRRAMLAGEPERLCRETCPMLQMRNARLEDHVLAGGPAPFVEAQLDRVEAILDGRLRLDMGPEMLHLPPVSACNYDCLMCEWGEDGTLDDELSDVFWTGLGRLLPGLKRVLVSSAGEPLLSPAFRRFVASFPFADAPWLELTMVTNASLLDERTVETLGRVPRCDVVVSLNAATAATYRRVNRGLPLARIRPKIDLLRTAFADGRLRGGLVYSMVLLRANHHELVDFCELAERDGAGVRLMLPYYDRGGQSSLTDRRVMETSLADLETVLRERCGKGWWNNWIRDVLFVAKLLRRRLDDGVEAPLP
ncbi:MAG: radical SAM protein [Deltaproteobacteria bacterium]|nr:radical SAM protein [Deltaproteobacteria bacterium]